ncbi:parathyroid hormone/parathyroid hormone-related peptide receptor-like [Plakobranchus ocellatus]|uniref:Parathyroid hormone/parathyroid hormone-related peptide receptor-like n=1 Tax=Plakobranchus ocellatus TaxID=259542 RepID=A0AAV4DQ54_9GAST|nr:parathyroid hormone/parathyroid hormone-related peptide receptor-like [Plakobranchus ocellatus]
MVTYERCHKGKTRGQKRQRKTKKQAISIKIKHWTGKNSTEVFTIIDRRKYDDKRRIYESYVRGEDYVDVARLLNVKRTTAYNIVKRAEQNHGQIERPRGGHRHAKVTDAMRAVVRAVIEEHPDFTIRNINRGLRTRLPQSPAISQTTISGILDGLPVTTKKLEDEPAERNSDRTKQQRHAYATWLMHEVQETEFIFIDEAGINIWTKRTRGRAVRGRRAVRFAQGRRGPNLTMTFAVSNVGGLIYHELTRVGMTGQRFNEFIGTVCRLYHPLNACFVIDNAPAHRQAVNLPLPQNFSVRYLPPYSPFLNICENAFALWKGNIKDSLAEVRDQLLREDHQQRMATLRQLAEQNAGRLQGYAGVPASVFRSRRHSHVNQREEKFIDRHSSACKTIFMFRFKYFSSKENKKTVYSSADVSPVTTPSSTPLTGGHPPKFGTVIPSRIFVGGIAANTTDAELKQYFSAFGAVKDTKIITDRAGVSKGFGANLDNLLTIPRECCIFVISAGAGNFKIALTFAGWAQTPCHQYFEDMKGWFGKCTLVIETDAGAQSSRTYHGLQTPCHQYFEDMKGWFGKCTLVIETDAGAQSSRTYHGLLA